MVSRKSTQTKGPKQLEYEIELFRHIRSGDRNPKLAILDDDGQDVGRPTKFQVKEYVDFGTVDGRHDLGIGIGFVDRNKNRLAISLTRKEAGTFLRFL